MTERTEDRIMSVILTLFVIFAFVIIAYLVKTNKPNPDKLNTHEKHYWFCYDNQRCCGWDLIPPRGMTYEHHYKYGCRLVRIDSTEN